MVTLNQIGHFFEVTEQLFVFIFSAIVGIVTFMCILFFFDMDFVYGLLTSSSLKFEANEFYMLLFIEGIVETFILVCLLLVTLINWKCMYMIFSYLKENSLTVVKLEESAKVKKIDTNRESAVVSNTASKTVQADSSAKDEEKPPTDTRIEEIPASPSPKKEPEEVTEEIKETQTEEPKQEETQVVESNQEK